MRKILLAISLFSITGLCGLNMPTSYECKGNNIHVMINSNQDASYSMMIEMGEQTYTDKMVIPEETMIGDLFSMTIFSAPDFMREHLVLLMPVINMIRMNAVEFETGMMRVVSHDSMMGPMLVDGAIDEYMGSYLLTCMAHGTARVEG